MSEEAGVHLGHPREQSLLVRGQRGPGPRCVDGGKWLAVWPGPGLRCTDRVDRGQLGLLGNDSQLLLPRERLLAHRLVAVIEAALVLVDPLAWSLVRRMAPARRVVQEERLGGRNRLGV